MGLFRPYRERLMVIAYVAAAAAFFVTFAPLGLSGGDGYFHSFAAR
jgi:hypothetical protein